jgi:hypothetical protein
MGGGKVRDVLLRQKHDRQEQKLKRKIKQLKGEKMALEMSVVREKERLRVGAEAVIKSMQDTERHLNEVLERMSALTAAELLELDRVMEEAGFFGRLRAGLRLAFTGRLV